MGNVHGASPVRLPPRRSLGPGKDSLGAASASSIAAARGLQLPRSDDSGDACPSLRVPVLLDFFFLFFSFSFSKDPCCPDPPSWNTSDHWVRLGCLQVRQQLRMGCRL